MQLRSDSVRPYYVQWCRPAGPWQTWNEQAATIADTDGIWLRGVFAPDDVTRWNVPEEAGPLLAPPVADPAASGAAPWWSPIAERHSDGTWQVVAAAPRAEEMFETGPRNNEFIPDVVAEHANLIWFNPGNRRAVGWVLDLGGSMQTSQVVATMSSGAYVPVGMGDVDGNLVSDVFLYDATQRKVAVWLLNASGAYQSSVVCNASAPMTSGWVLRAIGDIDRDGTADVVWHNSTSRLVAFWILNADGSLKSYGLCTNTAMSAGWSLGGSGDIDGDGTMDLLWHNTNTQKVACWFLNNDGTLHNAGYCTTNTMSTGWQMRGVGDIKGDGTMAILWHNSISKLVAYWFLDVGGSMADSGLSYSGTMSGGWELKATVDINDDGRMDAVWFNTQTRKTAYWLMDAAGTVGSSGYCTNIAVASGYTLHAAGLCRPGGSPGNFWVEVAGLSTGIYMAGADVLGSNLYHVGGLGQTFYTNVYCFNGASWAAVNGLPSARFSHAVCSYSGHLYAMGGSRGGTETNVYRFDGTNWTEVAGLPRALRLAASAVLHDRMYVIGGYALTTYTNAYRYDGTNWTEVAGLPAARKDAGAATLGGGLYVAGGQNTADQSQTNVYRFDGTNWTEVAGLPAPRARLTLTALAGALYAVGGMASVATNNVYKFDGSRWTEVAVLPAPRYDHAAAALGGHLYAIGGYAGSVRCTNVYRYQPE